MVAFQDLKQNDMIVFTDSGSKKTKAGYLVKTCGSPNCCWRLEEADGGQYWWGKGNLIVESVLFSNQQRCPQCDRWSCGLDTDWKFGQ